MIANFKSQNQILYSHGIPNFMRKTWDIFCSVIDNFGDIGVCWRLARQLSAEHNLQVRLWVDDLNVFSRLSTQVNPDLKVQELQGVVIYLWQRDWLFIPPADVVIEAFGCQLPTTYIDLMAQRDLPSLWLNLEYLSAEPWVGECHGLASPQLKGPNKYFFFPGFTAKTGGLIREKNLIAQRLAFQKDPLKKQNFLKEINVISEPNCQLISLFAYENNSLVSWLNELSEASQKSHLLVPDGRIVTQVKEWVNLFNLQSQSGNSKIYKKGSLEIQLLPFLSQDDYDRLLWSCDFNCVRGEDSFVRAQWAGKPFLWHIYPQEENIHIDKLESFLEIYSQKLSIKAKLALKTHWLNWNKEDNLQISWQKLREIMPELNKNAENWCFQQTKQINIAEALVEFYQNWLK